MALSPAPKTRLGYIDWIRGLACLLMFQTHCYDSWLGGSARQSRFFMYSQLGGTFPAPLFLFVAGISFALVTQRLLQKNQPSGQIARTTILRGAEILGFGLLFRVQEFVISWGWAPKSDLLRVDILNTIGLSMMLMGLVCWMVNMWARPAVHASQSPSGEGGAHGARPFALILVACGTALLISLLTPLLWTIWRPDWLPWPVESYINGVHNLGKPQAWLFPIFPWSAFAFAGLAVGFLLQSAWMRAREAKGFMALGMVGVALVLFSRWVDRLPVKLYPVYDYWHTSPEFFLIRLGMLMLILCGTYAWCRWGAGEWGFSPLIQLGQASLLVYWVHIEFVYGRVSILSKHAQGIAGASGGLAVIAATMLALAYIRTHSKGWRKGLGKSTAVTAEARSV
ncbi:MAG TPA: heparan-alpha-glucosaminide N-acetyltransferase domain-containing protein [Candidatus Sulfotelmatobacter sp.]